MNGPLDARLFQPQTSANYAEFLVDALNRWPGRIAFDDLTNQYTYDHCRDQIARITAVLEAAGGIRGRGFGVLSVNAAESWLAVAAVKIGGGYVVQLPTRGSPEDLSFFLNNSGATALFVHPDVEQVAAETLPLCQSIGQVWMLGAGGLGRDVIAAAEAAGSQTLRAAPDIHPEDIVEIKYTGGTTGVPKGAMHSHRSTLYHVIGHTMGPQVPYSSRYLASAPMSHSGYVFIGPTLYSGGTVVINKMFEPELFIRTVEEKRIGFVMAVPTMIYKLLDMAATRDIDFSSIERFIYGASPMSVARLGEAHDRFGQIFSQVYGVVECLGIGMTLPPGMHDVARPDLLASCGLPTIGVSATLLDNDGNPVADGETGEICLRGQAVMSGYRDRPDETRTAFEHGWLHTGDLAVRSPEGVYTIVDRKKDVIVSGGFNVFSSQVEAVIGGDARVAMVAVVGVPDPVWGEAVKAVVVAMPGVELTEAEICALVRDKKGPVNTPKTVDFVDDLPMTRLGKIDKLALRERYWAGQTRRVG